MSQSFPAHTFPKAPGRDIPPPVVLESEDAVSNDPLRPPYEELLRCHKELSDYVLMISKKTDPKNDFEFLKSESLLLFKTNQDLRELLKAAMASKGPAKPQPPPAPAKGAKGYQPQTRGLQGTLEKMESLRDAHLLEIKQEENKALKEEVDSLKDRISVMTREFRQKMDEFRIEDKQRQISELTGRAKAQSDKINEQATRISELESVGESLKRYGESKAGELKNYEEKFLAVQSRLVAREAELGQLIREKEQFDRRLAEANSQIGLLKQQLESSQRQASGAMADAQVAGKSARAAESKASQLEADLASTKRDLELASGGLEKMSQEKNDAILQVERLKKDLQTKNSGTQQNLEQETERLSRENKSLDRLLRDIETYFFRDPTGENYGSLLQRLKTKFDSASSPATMRLQESTFLPHQIDKKSIKSHTDKSRIAPEDLDKLPLSRFPLTSDKDVGTQTSLVPNIGGFEISFARRNGPFSNGSEGSEPEEGLSGRKTNQKLLAEVEKLEILNRQYQSEIAELRNSLREATSSECRGPDIFADPKVVEFRDFIERKIEDKMIHLQKSTADLDEMVAKIRNLKSENEELTWKRDQLIEEHERGLRDIQQLTSKVNDYHKEVFSKGQSGKN